VVNEAYIPILQDNGLASFQSVFRYQDGERLDKSNIGSWRERWRIELSEYRGERRTFYLKRYQPPPVTEQCRRILLRRARHGSAWWEWHNMRRLADTGIPTATPVACGEKMRWIFERRSFLVTEAIPGESLERWVPEHLGPSGYVDWRTRRDLIDRLARLVQALHRRRLVHRDLYLSHIFISHNRDGQAVFRLIDLQRVFRPSWRWRRWRIKDLAALHYSTPADCVPATDRMRFLHRYLGVRRLRPAHRRLIRGILARTRRTERHNRPPS
jgi:heptose I phosphotransferase